MKRSIAILTMSAMLLSSYMTMQAPASAAASTTTAISSSIAKGHIVGGVNLRNKPSLSSGKIIGFLKKGTNVAILDKSNKYYYKVKTSGGHTGYVSKSSKYIKLSSNSSQSKPGQGSEVSSSLTEKINLVIKTGKKYLGTPYEFGSDRSTTYTFDCSDFVKQAYKEALGIVLPADSRKQGDWIKEQGTAVYNIGSLKAGDLVFFMSYKGSSASAYAGVDKSSEKITHVAIYLGNGQLLQTYSNKSGGVRIDTLSKSWEHRFLFGGSVLK
ncbi:Gamma-DL-glutamyl hydrolase precursor [compost metagenome]